MFPRGFWSSWSEEKAWATTKMASYCFRYVASRMAESNPPNLSCQISYIHISTYIEHKLHMHVRTHNIQTMIHVFIHKQNNLHHSLSVAEDNKTATTPPWISAPRLAKKLGQEMEDVPGTLGQILEHQCVGSRKISGICNLK